MSEHSQSPDPAPPTGVSAPDAPDAPNAPDAAGQSLADALQVSFRLLSIIMIAVAAGFLLTGVKSIPSNQRGLVKVFGKVVRTAEPGLALNWPFPIGEIEIVDTREREVTVENFWLHVSPKDKTKPLSELFPPREGLRPGMDGVVLAGDRSLLHLRILCRYRVGPTKAAAYARAVSDPEEIVRTAVSAATVRQTAGMTGQAVISGENLRGRIRTGAQAQLDELLGPDVLTISEVSIESTWPLAARQAYDNAQRASQERQKKLDEAAAEAQRLLLDAAGGSYVALVGKPWETMGPTRVGGANRPAGRDLVAEFNRVAGDPSKRDEAAALLAEIDRILIGQRTGGEATKIIQEAVAQQAADVQAVEARVLRYLELLPEYKKDPVFMRRRLLADVYDEILASETAIKFVLSFGTGRHVLKVNIPPEILKRIAKLRYQAEKDRKARPRPSSPPPMPPGGPRR